MGDSERKQTAEIARLAAEERKLQLEAREIERRLNTPWWQGARLARYVLAVVITAALLFGWTRAYLEPILAKDKLIADKQNALNILEFEELRKERDSIANKNEELARQQVQIEGQLNVLKAQEAALKIERDSLREEAEALNGAIAGLNLAVELVASGENKDFSLVNGTDRINELKELDWEVWSDNYFGELGYYLVINHVDVRGGADILVTRQTNVDQFRQEYPDTWRQLMRKKTAGRHEEAPVVALDYSYLGLFVEGQSLVGGTVYEHGGGETKFYAPLSAWTERLAEILRP